MRRDLLCNVKRITAFVLSAALIMSSNVVPVHAEEPENVGATPQTDEEARNQDFFEDDLLKNGTKLSYYLAAKYPDLDTDHSGRLTMGEMNANKYTENGETRYHYTEININMNDFPDISKNMVKFNILGYLVGVKSITIEGVDEIRGIYIPWSLESLVIKDTTFNMQAGVKIGLEWQNNIPGDGERHGGGLPNVNLKTLRFENITMGDRFKNDPTGYSDLYASSLELDIRNCSNLEDFYVDLSFEEPSSFVSVRAGTGEYPHLTKEKCVINNRTQNEGNGQIIISSEGGFFKTNYSDAVQNVEFANNGFRGFLIGVYNADKNNDGYLTQEELDAITEVDINSDNLGRYNPISNLSDLAKLTNLETVKVSDVGRCDVTAIAFPAGVKNISIKNLNFDNVEISVTDVENFEFINNKPTTASYSERPSKIVINDTNDSMSRNSNYCLKNVTLDSSYISSVTLNNTSGSQGTINLSAYECESLEYIKFEGNGYKVSGDTVLDGCTILKGFGRYDESTSPKTWRIDGTFNGGNNASINIDRCLNWAKDLNGDKANVSINYDFTSNNQNLDIIAHTVPSSGYDPEVYFTRTDSTPGTVSFYCDSPSWIKTNYSNADGSSKTGYDFKAGSSLPTIAVFPHGNAIRKTRNSDGSFVDSWPVAFTVGGDVMGDNKLEFYVEEGSRVRKVSYDGKLRFRSSNEGIAEEMWGDNDTYADEAERKKYYGSCVIGKSPGDAEIYVYRVDTDPETNIETETLIGTQKIHVYANATGLILDSSSHTEAGDTEDNPIYIEKDNGRLTLTATVLPENESNIISDVIWNFYEYSEQYNKYISVYRTTSEGIRKVSDSKEDGTDAPNSHVNTRSFSISKAGKVYKATAQVASNKDSNNCDIVKYRYVAATEPCEINVSNALINGDSSKSVATITAKNSMNVSMSIKDEDLYNGCLSLVKDSSSIPGNSVFKLSICDSDWNKVKSVTDEHSTVTLEVVADYGYHEVNVDLRTLQPSSGDGENSDGGSSDSGSSDSGSSGAAPFNPTVENNINTNATVPAYVAPGKQAVSEITVTKANGTTSVVSLHIDGSISEKQTVPANTVAAINNPASINLSAPTVINSIAVVTDKSSAKTNAKIEKITAEVNATTIDGKIGITPQMVTGIKNSVSSQVGSAASKASVDIKVNTTDANGKAISIIVSTASLKSNASLKAYIIDPYTGGPIIINIPATKYNKNTGLTIAGLTGGFEYKLVSATEAKKMDAAVLNSVKLSDGFAKTVAAVPGASLDMSKAVSPTLNIANASKIEYSVSGNKAVIDPITGLLMINGNAGTGTITVSIKVTLRNGKVKTLKSKIKIG